MQMQPLLNYSGWYLLKPQVLILLFMMLFIGCTSTRWMVEDEYAVDEEEGDKISTETILQKAAGPVVDQPVLSLELYEVQEIEYPERLLARRYVQQYRPRYGIWALGLGTSAVLLGLAHTDLTGEMALNRNEQILLNSSAAVIAGASLLSMRPVGEPMDTGGERMLSKVGVTTKKDTVRLHNSEQKSFPVRIFDEHRIYDVETEATLMAGSAEINLPAELGVDRIEGEDPGNIYVEFEFKDRSYSYSFNTSDFMGRAVEITVDNAPLRSGPNLISGNILNNLARGAELPLREAQGDEWFQVEYGASPAYIEQDDARVIWKTGGGIQDDIILAGAGEFGELSLEQDIPHNPDVNEHARVVIWVNDNYSDERVSSIPNADRTVRLIETYAHQALGVPEDQIYKFRNLTYEETDATFRSDSLSLADIVVTPDSTDLIIYYIGHGVAGDDNREQPEAFLLPVDYDIEQPDSRRYRFTDWLREVAKVNTRSTTVFMETDFTGSSVSSDLEFVDQYAEDLNFQQLSLALIAEHENPAILFAASDGQAANPYISEDGRTNNYYGIFTYYVFQAIQDGNTELGTIYRILERNVAFSSRRIHDRAQDPLLFGNSGVNLLSNTENQE